MICVHPITTVLVFNITFFLVFIIKARALSLHRNVSETHSRRPFDEETTTWQVFIRDEISETNINAVGSHFLSESEFFKTADCWRQVHLSKANITRYDYINFAENINEHELITDKTEVAMLLTHIYRQTRGFNKTWCAFKACPLENDSKKYESRGYIGLSGKWNYEQASRALFGNDILVRDPNLIATNETIAWKTAFWFWMKFGHKAATSYQFGKTIAIVLGRKACREKQYLHWLNKILQLATCIYKKLNLNGTPRREGCPVLEIKFQRNATSNSNSYENSSKNIYENSAPVIEDNYENSSKNIVVIVTLLVITLISLLAFIALIVYRKTRKICNSSIRPSKKRLRLVGFKRSNEIRRNQLMMVEEIDSGYFGVVMKAELIGQKDDNGQPVKVAVKKVKQQLNGEELASLIDELKIYLKAGKHLNIINFLGAVTRSELMLVFEFCDLGNLRNYLLRNQKNFVNTFATTERSESNLQTLTTYDLLCYAYQISEGMKYLSSRNIVHRDLAARNVLLTKMNVVKLCDFGLARSVNYGNYYMKSNNALPLKWMSVEAIRDRRFTSQSDVWAFGVVLWEIFSLGCDPYPGVPIDENFVFKLLHGHRMNRPSRCPRSIFTIMEKCWFTDHQQRPKFDEINFQLSALLEKPTQDYYKRLRSDYKAVSIGCKTWKTNT